MKFDNVMKNEEQQCIEMEKLNKIIMEISAN